MQTRYALFFRWVESEGKLVVETNYFSLDSFSYALKEGWEYIGSDPYFEPEDIEAVRKAEEERFKKEPRGFWKRTEL